MRRSAIVVATALALSILAVPAPAAAADDERAVHPDVAYALDAVPGGIAVTGTTVVWPALGMTLSAGTRTTRSVGTCSTGSYCAYAAGGLSGTRLTFTICTTVSTAALRTVGSIANARLSGSVQARNAAGSALATASANGWSNVSGVTSTLRCTL